MLRINDLHSIPLIAQLVRLDYVAGSDVCLAHYNSDDNLTSGVIFNNSNNYSSEIHIASFVSKWESKELLYFTFFYAFQYRKWEKIFGRVPDSLPDALKMDIKLGFIVEAHLDDVFGRGVGMSIVSMRRERCKWLGMKPPGIKFPTLEQVSIVTPEPEFSFEVH